MDALTLWTPGNIVILFSGLVTVLTPAIISIILAIKSNTAVAAVGGQVRLVDENIKDVHAKVLTVEHNTNGKLSAQDREIAQLREEVKGLIAQLARQEGARATLAAEASHLTEAPKIIAP